ncbi:MAG: SurA N-terminal domain-containing protein [Bacteroidetes bacterium]|nr:SurA N-terminal domain-containing protein [Bacteroidota bacterium]
MAVIGRIRKHSGLAVILVGVAIAAFVLSDLFSARPNQYKDVGEIEDVKISFSDFNYRVEENIEAQKINQNKENLTYDEAFVVRNNTWDQYLNEILMDNEYEELGLAVSSDELFDLIQGNNPHRLILQYFVNPETGRFDREFVIRYLQSLNQMTPQQQRQWVNFEKYIKRDRVNTKYNNLISKGFYVPDAFAKMQYENQKKNAEFRYAYKKYADVPDSLVSYTDDEYMEYYEENKHKFEQEFTRDIDYIVFDVEPSDEDYEKTKAEVFRIFQELQYSENIEMFVNATSDNRYDSTWWLQGVLPVALDTIAFNAAPGTLIQPYFLDNAWHMGKLIDVQYRPDSMKAEHILIAYRGALRAAEDVTRNRERAQAIADSLYNILRRNPNRLQELAVAFSNDGSVQSNNGDLGWFPDGAMIHAFNEAVANGKPGDVEFIETPFGFHVLKITGKSTPVKKARVAVIDRAVEPSTETFQKIYVEASKFAGENNNPEKFEQAVIDLGLDKRSATYLKEMTNTIPGLDNPRSVVRWVFSDNAKVDAVSPVFDLDGKYLVALITAERQKGVISADEMRERLVNNMKNEKKGEYISELISKNGSSDLNVLARDLNLDLDTNYTLTFDSRNIPGFGAEHRIIGTIFAMNENEFKGPLQGGGAVFAIVVDRFGQVPETATFDFYKKNLETEFQRRVDNNYPYRAIMDNADIIDNRVYFY